MHLSTLRLTGRKIATVLIPALSSFQAGATWAQSQGTRSDPSHEAPFPIATARATIRDVPTSLKAIGTVVASESTVVRSGIKGKLTEIDFTDHQRVQVGDLLARVDPRGHRAQLDGTDLGSGELRAPTAGIAGTPLHHVGDIIAPADKAGLVAIGRVEPISVEFTLPASVLPVVQRQGADGPVRAWAYGDDKLHPLAEGTVVLADNGNPRRTDRGKLEAMFPNEDHVLSPGMRVEIRVRGNGDRAALTLPVSAIQRSAAGYHVYLVPEGRTAHLRPIALGTVSDGVAVVRDGLRPGDIVVTDGQYQLTEGSRVAIVEGPSPREDRK